MYKHNDTYSLSLFQKDSDTFHEPLFEAYFFNIQPTFLYIGKKLICKNIFTCLFSIHNTISLSRHEQVCLIRLPFARYFSHHRATYLIMSRMFKGNMQTFVETIKFADKKKLRNVTN